MSTGIEIASTGRIAATTLDLSGYVITGAQIANDSREYGREEFVLFSDVNQVAIGAIADHLRGVYSDRAHLLALLCCVIDAHLEQDLNPPTPQTSTVVVFDDPQVGQASWHIHDDDLPLFVNVPRQHGSAWDGHSTADKHRRIASVVSATSTSAAKETM